MDGCHSLKAAWPTTLCFIDYCNAVYQGLTEKSLQKLQKIENNAVRFIFGLHGKRWKENITPYLKQLHFLPVRYRIKFKIALLVYKCINNLAPDYLKGLLKLRTIHPELDIRIDPFDLQEYLEAKKQIVEGKACGDDGFYFDHRMNLDAQVSSGPAK